MKTILPATLLAAYLGVPQTGKGASAERPPNLIVILTDDQGYADVGLNGCKDIPTPNLDSITANGVHFPNGYVSYPVCSPSRAGLLTGRYEQRFGHERNPRFQPENPESGGLYRNQPLRMRWARSAINRASSANGIWEPIPKSLAYQNPVISLDIFATIAAQAKAPVDPARPLDGVDLMPCLTGGKTGAPVKPSISGCSKRVPMPSGVPISS